MAISGSTNFSVSTQTIITEALELLGVLGEGQSYTNDQYLSSLRTLNMMTKTWQTEGLNLFAVQPCYLFLKNGQQEYTLSSSSSDHFTASLNVQSIAIAASLGNTSVTLTDASGVTGSMHIGIGTSTSTLFWTTVTSVVGNVVNLTNALTSDVTAGSTVYYYLTPADRPMRLLEAYVRRSGNVDIPIGLLSRIDYYSLSRKDVQSTPLQMYMDPQRTQSNLFVWPTASSEIDFCILICQRTLDDFDVATDEPDYPQEWFMALALNLAVHLAPKYGTPQMDYQRLVQLAMTIYEKAKGWDEEQEVSMYLKPDTWGSDFGRRGG